MVAGEQRLRKKRLKTEVQSPNNTGLTIYTPKEVHKQSSFITLHISVAGKTQAGNKPRAR